MKILFLVMEDWYFWSHRLPLALAVQAEGFEVIVATRVQDHGERIIQEGFKLIPIRLRRKSRNPLREFMSVIELMKIYRDEQPTLVHHVAIKAAIYGTLAARLARVPAIVNAFAGMGYIFSSSQTRAKMLKHLIKIAFRLFMNAANGKVIIQNPEDRDLLVSTNILKRETVCLIKGSGVDPKQFLMYPEPPGEPLVALASRMLWDKGVGEFVEVARILLHSGRKARFVLIGKNDPDNPSSIPVTTLQKWHEEGAVEWWGYRENMPAIFAQAHIVCLPSFYGEGVPKVLIEAACCGRAIVTTDTPGCREIVRDGENGILVPPHNVEALAKAICRLIDSPAIRGEMGKKGRGIAVKEFSEDKVISQTIALYGKLLTKKGHS